MINVRYTIDEGKADGIRELPIVFGSHSIKLTGKVLLPQDSNADNAVPAAVLCHGFGASHRAVEPSAQILTNQGIATLIFDFRGHGSSEGAVDGKMAEDIIDAWNLLSQLPEVDSERMGLIGHSLGAMSVILAAGKVSNPRALIALSCPADVDNQLMGDEAANVNQWGKDNGSVMEYPREGAFPWLKGVAALICRVWMYLFRYRVRVDWQKFVDTFSQISLSETLRKLKGCSKLFVFCEGDRVTPYNKSVLVYEAACGSKEMFLAKGGFHTTPLLPGNLRSRWTNWVIKTLTDA